MPVSKRYMKKRTKFARKFKPRVPLTVKRYVKKAIHANIEDKLEYVESVDNAVDVAAYSGSPVPWPIQGTEAFTTIDNFGTGAQGRRIGNDIRIKKLQFNCHFRLAGASHNVFRMVFVQAKQSTVAIPSLGDIFLNSPGGEEYLGIINPLTKYQFHILYDRIFSLTENSNSSQYVKRIILRPPITKIRFTGDGQSGQAANIEKGPIYFFILSNASSLSLIKPLISWQCYLTFEDA